MNRTSVGNVKAGQAIGTLNKGMGQLEREIGPEEIARLDWNLLREDLSLPAAVLYADRLQHNLEWMRRFIDAYGVRLAPHGKTTMAPKLFDMQLESGAWGITLATAHQTLVAYEHGVRRVLMANELVGKANMAMVARMLADPSFDYYCLVDSAELVEQLGAYFRGTGRPIQVLVELGVEGGRCGVRDDAQLQVVLEALSRYKEILALRGIEIYEGVLSDETAIRGFLQRACDVMRRLLADRQFAEGPVLLSGAGSAWYDVVAEEFTAAGFGDSVQVVLRPGCYLTHDVGAYQRAQTRILANNPIAREMHSGLLPALHVWAYVQSIPEQGRAIVGLGRRDAAFDSGLPVPALHYRPGHAKPKATPGHWEMTKLMDQHGYLQIKAGDDVRVGDMIGFDICHPCLTFDKWRTIPIVDESYQVTDIVQTYF